MAPNDDQEGFGAGARDWGGSSSAATGGQGGEIARGTQIGGYRVEAVAGGGGMGAVYRATQLGLGRTVALKVIAPQFAADPGFRERFRRESRLAASLEHPNVVTVYEAGEDAGRLFVSMRFVEGPDLRQLLDAEGPLSPERAVGLVSQVGAALDAAHAAGLVHRDIKPANILIERRDGIEHAYLTDFGLVKRIGTDPELTGSTGWVGTVDYVAPEQVSGSIVDARTDIYALGAVLYTALSGRVPYPRDHIAAKLYASVNEAVPALDPGRPNTPAGLDAVVARATAKDPSRRYATAGELAGAAIAAITATAATTPLPGSRWLAAAPLAATRRLAHPLRPRSWRRAAPALAAALAVVAGGTAAAVTLTGGRHGHPRAAATHRPTSSSAGVTSGAGGASPGRGPTYGGLVSTTGKFSAFGGPPEQQRITLFDLRRHGALITLDFGIACVAATGTLGCGPELTVPLAWNGTAAYQASTQTAAGVRLIDPAGKKLYQPVLDDQQRPYSTTVTYFDPGPLHLESTTFAAPPAGTATLDVAFASGGPLIAKVPVSSGPARLPSGSGVLPAVPSPFTAPPSNPDPTAFNLNVLDLAATVANTAGSDQESAGRSTVALSADVLFAFNRATLSPKARSVLAPVAERIKRGAKGAVAIAGYTDSVGTDQVNLPLSRARARAVAAALTPRVAGAPVTFKTSGLGAQHPIAHNTNADGSDNPAGRALNRRVTISYAVKVPAAPVAPPPSSQAPPAPGVSSARTVDFKPLQPSGSNAHDGYRVTVNGITRHGPYVVLDLTATCTAGQSSCDGGADFASDMTTVSPAPASQVGATLPSLDTLSAAYLTDATGNSYLPIRDSSNDPLSSSTQLSWDVGEAYRMWVYFPVPGPSVRSVTVVLPGKQPASATYRFQPREPSPPVRQQAWAAETSWRFSASK